MALMTMIARASDGLPLVGSMHENEQTGSNILEYQNQAKLLFRKLDANTPSSCSIETGPYFFHFVIENGVCFLVMCDKKYSRRLAFNYLNDIALEFNTNYGRRIDSVTRPYAFIEFDVYIQRAKGQLTDRRRNINAINTQLQDVKRIMVQNIDDVLLRGTVLSELDMKTQNLSMMSQKYKKHAETLNRRAMLVKAAAGIFIFLLIVFYFWIL